MGFKIVNIVQFFFFFCKEKRGDEEGEAAPQAGEQLNNICLGVFFGCCFGVFFEPYALMVFCSFIIFNTFLHLQLGQYCNNALFDT